jgi:hypothetical protein
VIIKVRDQSLRASQALTFCSALCVGADASILAEGCCSNVLQQAMAIAELLASFHTRLIVDCAAGPRVQWQQVVR